MSLSSEVAATRKALFDSIAAEIAALLPRLPPVAYELVALLHVEGVPLSMRAMCDLLGRSIGRVHGGLRLLEAAGIIARRREPGLRHATFALCGPYPEVVIDAFVVGLRRVRAVSQERAHLALGEVRDVEGPEVTRLRVGVAALDRDLTGALVAALLRASPDQESPSA